MATRRQSAKPHDARYLHNPTAHLHRNPHLKATKQYAHANPTLYTVLYNFTSARWSKATQSEGVSVRINDGWQHDRAKCQEKPARQVLPGGLVHT